MSIVKRHVAKKSTKQVGASSPVKSDLEKPVKSDIKTQFEQLKLVMETDLTRLKSFDDIDDKASYKAQVIDKNGYMDFVLKYAKSGATFPNSVLVWVFIWLVDLKRWEQVLELLPVLVSQGQKLPTRFKTQDWSTFVGDYLYDHASYLLSKGENSIIASTVRQDIGLFLSCIEKSELPINNIVHGKVLAIAGKLESACFNYGNALHFYMKATKVNDGAGVKKIAKETAKLINKEISI